ncbi:MAG: PAS domain S-box protein [Bacteroidetes bacterium]|nr:PAS domain S-box protein [Bacteroidota bacterium]
MPFSLVTYPAGALRHYVLCILFCVLGLVLHGQQYNFQQYSVNNGLPHTQINCVFQDSSGYVWVGSEGGLSRFDGKIFETFSFGEQLPGNNITAISQTAEGVIVATNKALCWYRSGKFSAHPFPVNSGLTQVNQFLRGEGGELLLCTNRGLWKYEKHKYSFIVTSTPLDHLSLKSATFDSHNKLWVGSSSNGLFCLVKNNQGYANEPFSDQDKLVTNRIRGIVEVDNRTLWIATSDNGLFSYDGQTMNRVILPEGMSTTSLTCMQRDAAGDIWLGTWGSGLLYYHNGIFRNLTQKNGLNDDIILSILCDNQGNIWLGTYQQGLIFYYGEMFVTYTVKDGLPSNNVRAVRTDGQGNVWMATLVGVSMFDGTEFVNWTAQNGLSNNRVGALSIDKKGNVYAGTFSGEINIIRPGNRTPEVIFPDKNNNPGEILSLCITRDGMLWIGTASHGLFTYSNRKIESYNTGNELLGAVIWSIYEDFQGIIWLGTSKGLYMLDHGKVVRPLENKPTPAEELEQTVFDITGDETYIYFATQRSGIWRYNRKMNKYQILNQREGIGSDFTRGLFYQPEANVMFVTTILGCDRIIFREKDQLIQHFWHRDGIGTTNFTPATITTDNNGRIWFGSVDGAVVYSPALSRKRNQVPKVEFKALQLFNQPVTDWSNYADSVMRDGLPFDPVFPYNKNTLTFVFTGIQFGTGLNLSFEYKLIGRDTGWVKLNSGNSVSFNDLAQGEYTFLLKARNDDDYVSEPRSYSFTISPPFWKSSWFFLVSTVCLLIIIFALIFVYRNFREDFIRDQRSLYNHNLTVGRFVLFTAAFLYPVSGSLIRMFSESTNLNLPVMFAIGVLMMLTGLLSYSVRLIKEHTHLLARFEYGLLIFHMYYLCYYNKLAPVPVIMLILVLSAIGLLVDRLRQLIAFASLSLFLSISLVIVIPSTPYGYNGWLFLLAILVGLIIAFISVITRLNLFNRLIFADTIINNSSSIVLAVDQGGSVVFASKSVTTILGYEQHEVLGDGWWKVRSDDYVDNLNRKQQVINMREARETYISPIKTKNGRIRWIQWQDTILEGNLKVGVGLDVTDRQEMEERYRHIVETANDIIYTADFKGCFTYTNEVAVKILGYELSELIGRHFSEFVHPDWVQEVTTFYAKQFQRRLLSTTLEFPVISGDGGIVWLGQTVRIIIDDEHPERIKGFQAIARDITEKKQYEEELEKLSLVASETINGVLICDPESNIEWVNEGFTRITGYSLAEVRNRRAGDVLKGEKTNMATIYNARERVRTGQGFEVELLVYNRDGNEIWISVSNTPIVDENGRLLKQIEIFTDISEKKRYELQLSRYSKNLELLNNTRQRLLDANTVESLAASVLPVYFDHIHYTSRVILALIDERQDLIEVYEVTKENVGDKPQYILLSQADFLQLDHIRLSRYRLITELNEQNAISIFDQRLLASGVRSYLATTLQIEGKVNGFLSLCSDYEDAVDDSDIDLMDEVADVMASTIQQIRYREIIQQKNNDISSSINYARRIQNAILPPEEVLRKELGDMFVLFRPKDILCGDYYWAETRGNYIFVAVADSTGHGVPGALLSLMGHNLLNQAIRERHLTRPAAILDFLNLSIQQTLNQYKQAGELHDGMDIALCVFERKSRTMMFAGAINPLYIVRGQELIQVKGNRFSIGSYFDFKSRPFDHQEVEIKSGDMLYMFTDGYPDQFGGDHDRKLSYRRFRELLIQVASLPAIEQREILTARFSEWMGKGNQTDDVCVLGIRVD